MLERFDREACVIGSASPPWRSSLCTLGVLWISVRGDYRERFLSDAKFEQSRSDRLDSIRRASTAWASSSSADLADNVDAFVERMWAIFYPALAVARVPSVVPYANGALMSATLQHVLMPRVFFPDKAKSNSDSGWSGNTPA